LDREELEKVLGGAAPLRERVEAFKKELQSLTTA